MREGPGEKASAEEEGMWEKEEAVTIGYPAREVGPVSPTVIGQGAIHRPERG